MAKRGGKKKSSRKKSKKTRKHKKPKARAKKILTLEVTSIVLTVISLIVMVAYVIALIMSEYVNGTLLLFTYLAALVIFIIALLGVGLSTADLAANPKNKITKTTLYINFIILIATFTLVIFKLL